MSSSGRRWHSARVAVVGGGLAGLSAAVALAQAGVEVELFESRRRLGGRASSFRDPATGEVVDHCQHVSMSCCTNLADFCHRVGIRGLFRQDRTLHFFGPRGDRYDVSASWAPAPLHLAPALLRLGYLSRRERLAIAQAMWSMMRERAVDDPAGPTIGEWLRAHRQSPRGIDQFWSVVLVSALSETVDRASLFYARKVFVDGFLLNRNGYVLEVPTAPLDRIYGKPVEDWLQRNGVRVRMATPIEQVSADASDAVLTTKEGQRNRFDYAILAVPWNRIGDVGGPKIAALPELAGTRQFESAPITGVHLWFDAPITPLPHAVLVGGLCQWLFRRPSAERAVTETAGSAEDGCHYQVVISASRNLAGEERERIIEAICRELAAIFPAARAARLLRYRIVTERDAVFSPLPGIDRLRPRQQTSIPTVGLAGDWTATGWPATMEGAVRSGRLAAAAALAHCGKQGGAKEQAEMRPSTLADDLPRSMLSNWLVRR